MRQGSGSVRSLEGVVQPLPTRLTDQKEVDSKCVKTHFTDTSQDNLWPFWAEWPGEKQYISDPQFLC